MAKAMSKQWVTTASQRSGRYAPSNRRPWQYRHRFSMHTQNAFDSESTPFVPMDMRSSPFMSGSWEVYEWLMSKQWVATATQRIILNSFTSFNYQHICHICFRVNTMSLNSYSPVMNSLESRYISDSWVTPIYQIHEWLRRISQQA